MTVLEAYNATHNQEEGWNMEDGSLEFFNTPLKVKEVIKDEISTKVLEIRGVFGGHEFKSNDGKLQLKTLNGIRGVGIKSVAVRFKDGYLVFY